MRKKIKCSMCQQEQLESMIFVHMANCEKDIRYLARDLIAELERELGEQE